MRWLTLIPGFKFKAEIRTGLRLATPIRLATLLPGVTSSSIKRRTTHDISHTVSYSIRVTLLKYDISPETKHNSWNCLSNPSLKCLFVTRLPLPLLWPLLSSFPSTCPSLTWPDSSFFNLGGAGAGAGSTTSYSGGSVVDHKDDNDAAPKKRRIIHQHVGDQAHFDSDKAMMKETANELADLAAQQGDTAHEEQLRDAASRGDFDALTELLTEQHVHLIHRRDENEWQLLHEAVRSGDLKSVKLLIDMGADVSAKVLSGGAALWIAKYYLEPDHPVTNYLREIGAPDDGLEL
eukprot:CAMPEP_0175003598 /NCGR_PEP_ID=MMETSP0005-20121125/4312_1 /TAXON_ID=420556 /ORGANISM="Ochromonas sp., Strain CCMP1393" /LENGTH=291 /DNA_ID=CAMNT_0016258681 /DNA_START=1885 /DNA_END=2759 /DNA_ORIENTATION=+